MTSKLTILGAITLALLVANTFASHTTVTTVEVEEDNQGRQSRDRCRQQGQLHHCERYLRQQSQGGWDISIEDDNQQGQSFQQCCQQLRQMDEDCVCQRLRDLVEEDMEMEQGGYGRRGQGGYGGRGQGRQQEQRMRQRARNLPNMCGLRQRQCHF